MFEGAVASLLNRYLSKYFKDLDLDSLNVGIFSGNVELNGLKLKPEALYELGLPIIVKVGVVGKLNINIPWTRLCNQTSTVTIEDIYILVCPVTMEKYDENRERNLLRVEKRRLINVIDSSEANFFNDEATSHLAETLIVSVFSNLKIYVRNVHVRYEDDYTNNAFPMAIGFCIHSFCLENTNSKWKPISRTSKMGSIYQIVKIESFSIYCNASCSNILSKKETRDCKMLHCLKHSLETFKIGEEPFNFLVKPLSARFKIILTESNEPRIPKLLFDFVLQDAVFQLSHQQYLALVHLVKSFKRIRINRLYRKYRTQTSVRNNAKRWWKYAYDCVICEKIKPYTWSQFHLHRKNYHKYCDLYRKILLDPTNIEIKMDLQRIEDLLDIYSIITAREHTKMKLRRERPDKVIIKERFFKNYFWSRNDSSPKEYYLSANVEKCGFWNQLLYQSKESSGKINSFIENDELFVDKSKDNIEYKFNFTIANLTCSLISGGSEILVATMSHLLSSIEIRPAMRSYKFSTRIESVLVEGASVEYNLIPIITSENILEGNQKTYFLEFDFEKKPVNCDVDYVLFVRLGSVEIIYHEFSLSLLVSFLHSPIFDIKSIIRTFLNEIIAIVRKFASDSIHKHNIFQLNVDMKLPYFVVPEYGSVQKNENTMLFDLGHLKIWSDLQLPYSNLEDITQSELEEKLYNRFHFVLKDFQIFLFKHDQNWSNFRKINNSQCHVISKIHSQIIFSDSIKPENKQLPRHKLNVSLQKLKISLSDSRMITLLNFFDNLPCPKNYTVFDDLDDFLMFDQMKCENCLQILRTIQQSIALIKLKSPSIEISLIEEDVGTRFSSSERINLLSEMSEEDSEMWMKILTLPGFDSNSSPNNSVSQLFRLNIGQIVLELKRTANNNERPYISINFVNLCVEIAFMEYGFASQISLGSASIVDELHSCTNSSSEPIRLLSTGEKSEFVSVLYRKVRSDCPDFKTHFHGVEQSLAIELNPVHVICHRQAMIDLHRYIQYLVNKFGLLIIGMKSQAGSYLKKMYKFKFKSKSPPIAPGATKLSYSIHISSLKFYLCDAEIDFLLVEARGFEFNFVMKANERIIFKSFLASFAIHDISNTSIYSKILSVEEERLMEIKYDRRTAKIKKSDIDATADNIKSDGSFKLDLGRINFVLTFKLVNDAEKFFNPFISIKSIRNVLLFVGREIVDIYLRLRFCNEKINVFVDCRFPTLFLPQQASSPNLIIYNIGDLKAENFFKKLTKDDSDNVETAFVTDNMLIEWDAICVSRAVANLSGCVIVQETIMEPLCCKMDSKRLMVNGRTKVKNDRPIFDVNFNANKIRINIGQRDLRVLNAVWFDNVARIIALWESKTRNFETVLRDEEAIVRKLQQFLYQSESSRKDIVLRSDLGGIELRFYNDIDEVVSSPIRDENRSLCKFKIGEILTSAIYYLDGKHESQFSIQSFLVEDTRPMKNISIRKILQSYGATTSKSNNRNVSVTVPPVISATINRNANGDCCCDILIDYTRLNFSVPFLTELSKFCLDAVSYEEEDGSSITAEGLINYGYTGENAESTKLAENDENESNNAKYKSEGMSLLITFRKPEIMLFSHGEDFAKNHALLIRCDLSVEYIHNPTKKNFTCQVTDLHITSRLQSKLTKAPSDVILWPCSIEISHSWTSFNNEKKISVACDTIDMHIAASTVRTVLDIIRELRSDLRFENRSDETKPNENEWHEYHNLWSPVKITPFCFPGNNDDLERKYVESRNSGIQNLIVSVPNVSVMFEIEDIVQKKPVIAVKMGVEGKLKNWSSSLEMKGDFILQCSYYNYKIKAWEPFIEPTTRIGNTYRPWEMSLKAFKSKSHPLCTILRKDRNERTSISKKRNNGSCAAENLKKTVGDNGSDESSAGEGELDNVKMTRNDNERIFSTIEKVDYVLSESSSDSENEDTVIEKLKSKFDELLIRESVNDDNADSESELSEDEGNRGSSINSSSVSDANDDEDDETNESSKDALVGDEKKLDGNADQSEYDKAATYIIIETRERLELVVTPCLVSVVKQIVDSFSLKFNNILSDTQFLTLRNDLTPRSTVTLFTKNALGVMDVLTTANYSFSESSASSRNSIASVASDPCNVDDLSDLEFSSGIENFEGGFALDDCFKANNLRCESDAEILSFAFQFPRLSVDNIYHDLVNQYLQIKIEDFDDLTVICPMKPCNKCHVLRSTKNGYKYHAIVSVENDLWNRKIFVRSPLQIKNETCFTVALYYKKNEVTESNFKHIGEITNPFEDSYKFAVVEPNDSYYVPITIAYHCPVYILPLHGNFLLSDVGIWWKELATGLKQFKDIMCRSKDEKTSVFVTKVLMAEGVTFCNSHLPLLPNFVLKLLPSLIIYNLLPCALIVNIPSVEFNIRIEAGGKSSVYSLDLNVKNTICIEVPLYFGVSWTGSFSLCYKLDEKLLPMKTDQQTDAENKTLSLNVRAKRWESHDVTIFSPYWIINKTGLRVQIKATQSDIVCEAFAEEPLFFSFRKNQKRIVRLRVYNSSWSSPISPNPAECCQLIVCRDRERNRVYHILLEISLSHLSPSSTKIITLLPYFSLSNECHIPFRYMEENERVDLWNDLPQNQIIPFWPETNSMKMCIKFQESSQVSQHFRINEVGQIVLRMDNGTAIVVDVTGGQNTPFLIIFRHYKEGDAPVRIDNLCEDLFLKISQKTLEQVSLLSPYQSLLYTWDDPTIVEKKLVWNVYNHKSNDFSVNFESDDYGQKCISFKLKKQSSRSTNTFLTTDRLTSSLKKLTKYVENGNVEELENDVKNGRNISATAHEGKVMVYWVSYFENEQRVLLFTQDERFAQFARSRIHSERSTIELFVSMKGIGFSLMKDHSYGCKEFGYFSLTDSTSIWEVNVAHCWKLLPLELATWIEYQWSLGAKLAQMKDYVIADLGKMYLLKPFFGELRRTYNPSIWIHYRKSANFCYFRWKIYKFQIDNQLPDCTFSTIVYPKISFCSKQCDSKCFDLTLLKRRKYNFTKNIYKYIKLTASDICVKLDKQFLLSMYELFEPCFRVESSCLRIRADICRVHQPLVLQIGDQCYKNTPKSLIEYLYVSSINVEIHLSMQKIQNLHVNIYDSSYIRALLHYALNLIDFNYIECGKMNLSYAGLEEFSILTHVFVKLKLIQGHYCQRLIRSFFSKTLRINNTNQFGSEIDLRDTCSSTTNPSVSTSIKEIHEFAEAISEEARCLLSHVISSTVLTNSALIVCEKRTSLDLGLNCSNLLKIRPMKNALATNFDEPKPVLKGDMCFEIEVLYGLSGVCLNFLNDAKENGLELFFRTVGKNLLKLLNNYIDDAASISLAAMDSIQRAAETGTDIIFRQRLPKHASFFGLRPYSTHHCIGMNILHSLNKGIYSESDYHWNHIVLTSDSKSCLLLTLQRIFFITKHNLWSDWDVQWCIEINDLVEIPHIVKDKLICRIQSENCVHRINNSDKVIEHEDESVLFWIQKMIEIIFIINLENKPHLFVESGV